MADATEMDVVEEEEQDKNWLSELVTNLGVMDFLNREYKMFDLFIGTVAAWTTLVISFLSFIFFLVAFSTSRWARVELENSVGDVIVRYIGLWNECPSYGGCTSDITVQTDAFRACQAFAIIALLVIASSIAFCGGYIFWDRYQRQPMLALAITVSKGISVFSLLLLISIWSDNWYKPDYDGPGFIRSLNYSYGFAVTTFVTEIFGLLFAAIEYYQAWRDDKKMMGKLVPDAERNNPGCRSSMTGEAGYETTELSAGGGGTGWGELPDKQKNSGADWGELPDLKHKSKDGGWGELPDLKHKSNDGGWGEIPDLKHKSNSGGWGELPDIKRNTGGAGWNELPDRQCDQDESRYSGGDSPITVSPGNLYQYNPERGRTTPSSEFQKYYMEQISENSTEKPHKTDGSNHSRAQQPNRFSNQSYTDPYVSVSAAGATYDKRNRTEGNLENDVRGQGRTRSSADMGSVDAVDAHKSRGRKGEGRRGRKSDYDQYGGEKVNNTDDIGGHNSVHNDFDKNPYVNKSDTEAKYDNTQRQDYSGVPPKYDNGGDRSYQDHNHRDRAPPSENNPVAPSRHKRSPRKPNLNYDNHNGHDASQVPVNPVSNPSVADNQPTSPRPAFSESFI